MNPTFKAVILLLCCCACGLAALVAMRISPEQPALKSHAVPVKNKEAASQIWLQA